MQSISSIEVLGLYRNRSHPASSIKITETVVHRIIERCQLVSQLFSCCLSANRRLQHPLGSK